MSEDELMSLFNKVTPLTLGCNFCIVEPKNKSIDYLGCCVFLKIEEKLYVLTVGHLMNIKDFPKLMIPSKEENVVKCRGKVFTTYKEFGDTCKFDIAVFQFAQMQLKYFENFRKFISPNDICINHKQLETSSYIISGYPITGVKKKTGKQEFDIESMKILTGSLRDEVYKKFGYNKDTHILIRIAGTMQPYGLRVKQKMRNFTGISGSGLGYVPNWNDRNADGIPKHCLIGILTDNYVDQGYLVAIKIDFAIKLIENHFRVKYEKTTSLDINNSLKTVWYADTEVD